MAARTTTGNAAKSGIQPRALHAGVNVLWSTYTTTATLSAGDIIKVGRIPNGARVVNAFVGCARGLGDSCKLSLGSTSDHDQLIESASFATANRVWGITATGLGAQFTVSDSANAANGTMLELKVSDMTGGTGTTSAVISTIVMYTLDP